MENDDIKNYQEDLTKKIHDDITNKIGNRQHGSRNRTFIGLLLVAGGILLLINKLGVAFFPEWFFTWPVFLIALGFIIGLQHNFKNIFWLLMIVWGVYWLLDQQMPSLQLHNYTTPAVLILIGLFFIARRKNPHYKNWKREHWRNYNNNDLYFNQSVTEDGEFIDSTCVFSGTKKVVISKNFKGADITCFMGGAEIDLSQADIQGSAVIDGTVVFGGIKLIVPANWDVKVENNAAFFGNIEDKRNLQNINADPSKKLIIDSTAVFGGIEIKNY